MNDDKIIDFIAPIIERMEGKYPEHVIARAVVAGVWKAMVGQRRTTPPLPTETEWDLHCAFYRLTADQRDRAWQEIEEKKDRIAKLEEVLHQMVEGEDRRCVFDHNGACQEHGLGEIHGMCDTAYARKLLGLTYTPHG